MRLRLLGLFAAVIAAAPALHGQTLRPWLPAEEDVKRILADRTLQDAYLGLGSGAGRRAAARTIPLA